MHIDVVRESGVRFSARIGRHEVVFDQPLAAGGTDLGPTPTDVFVASLAGCVAYYAERFLERHGHAAEGLRVSADFTMADHPARVAAIELSVRLPDELSDTTRRALQAVVEHCTVHNSIVDAPLVRIAIEAPIAVAR